MECELKNVVRMKDLGGTTINIDGGIHVISTRLEKVQVKCVVGDEAKVITHTYRKGTRTREAASPKNVGKTKTTIHFNGREFNSFEEMNDYMANEGASDPNNDILIWDSLQSITMTFVNGKMVSPVGDGEYGKCTYRGKVYEGKITYEGNKLFVRGDFVKEI